MKRYIKISLILFLCSMILFIGAPLRDSFYYGIQWPGMTIKSKIDFIIAFVLLILSIIAFLLAILKKSGKNKLSN